ncbi:hypothetical protein Ancab_037056 [Ancistrocladus abbreviatus]
MERQAGEVELGINSMPMSWAGWVAFHQATDVTATKGNHFEDHSLKRELLMGTYENGVERPSPIQELSIPLPLTGRDILARAENGTGTTAAFCIPALDKIHQDCDACCRFLCHLYFCPFTCRNTWKNSRSSKKGMISLCRQSWSPQYLHRPHLINLMDELTLKGIVQYHTFVEERQKVHCLNTLFSKLQINQSIIFCYSVNWVELLAKKITQLGYSFFYIHAKMLRDHHNRVFHIFRIGTCRNLVGIDIGLSRS